jgi:hypothetical protein
VTPAVLPVELVAIPSTPVPDGLSANPTTPKVAPEVAVA